MAHLASIRSIQPLGYADRLVTLAGRPYESGFCCGLKALFWSILFPPKSGHAPLAFRLSSSGAVQRIGTGRTVIRSVEA